MKGILAFVGAVGAERKQWCKPRRGEREMVSRVLFSSSKQDWRTPKEYFDGLNAEFHFNHDPCPAHPLIDGLLTEWGKTSFVNPPYNEISKWAKKAFEEHQKGKTVVMLIPSRTDTKWWHAYCMKATEIRFIKGRLKFEGAKFNAPFPSCLIIFKESTNGK
jgi:site-specific DNA-methyltransferase (adenine-specific)